MYLMAIENNWIKEKNYPFFTYFRIIASNRIDDEIPLDFLMVCFLRKFAANGTVIDKALTVAFEKSKEYKGREDYEGFAVDIGKLNKDALIPSAFLSYASRGKKLSGKLRKACSSGNKPRADVNDRIRGFLKDHLPLRTKNSALAVEQIQGLFQELDIPKAKRSELAQLIKENKTIDFLRETFQLVLDAEYDVVSKLISCEPNLSDDNDEGVPQDEIMQVFQNRTHTKIMLEIFDAELSEFELKRFMESDDTSWLFSSDWLKIRELFVENIKLKIEDPYRRNRYEIMYKRIMKFTDELDCYNKLYDDLYPSSVDDNNEQLYRIQLHRNKNWLEPITGTRIDRVVALHQLLCSLYKRICNDEPLHEDEYEE